MSILLAMGSRGPDVVQLQTLLNTNLSPSPNLDTDGIFGQLTNRAVVRFQSQNWLTVDGIVNALNGTESFVYYKGRQPA